MLSDGRLVRPHAAPWGVLVKHGGGDCGPRDVEVRSCVLLLVTTVLGAFAPPASAEPVVSPVPGKTPAVLDGQVYALAKVGNTVVVGGSFTSARSWGSTTVGDPVQHPGVRRRPPGSLVSGFAPTSWTGPSSR